MNTKDIIGHNIRINRRLKGVKQAMLAKYLGITTGRLSQIENGECAELTIGRLESIAAYLKVDFFDLVRGPEHEPKIKVNGVAASGVVNLTPEATRKMLDEIARRLLS